MSNATPHETPTIEACCLICATKSILKIGLLGVLCENCKSYYAPFEMTMPDVVRLRREQMKLTRKQIGQKLKYAASSIKKYELIKCTTPYFIATEVLFKEYLIINEMFT